MAKMLVALMMHGVMAKRSNNWLAETKHLSVREQSEEELSMDEYQVDVAIKSLEGRDGFQDVWHDSQARWNALIEKPLDVTASAVAFCGELLKEVQQGDPGSAPLKAIREKSMAAEDLCPKILTGSLGAADPNATKFAKKAAKVAQLDGKRHEFGRLDNVPWKKSLHRVCHDECHALVEGIKNKAEQMQKDFDRLVFDNIKEGEDTSKSLEEICADRVIREVESEIMTCCASSCGWNGRSCMYWPLMNSTEHSEWESECCVEMNILNGSTREKLCDSTLTKHDKEISNPIIDNRSNTAKDREIIGQDGNVSVGSSRGGRGHRGRRHGGRGASFMETSSMTSFNGNCPKPLDLDQLHKNWTTDWKVMDLKDLKSPEGTQKENTVSKCAIKKERQPTINGCKVFQLLQLETEESEETNSEETNDKNKKQRTYDYKCLDDCHMQKPAPEKVRNITDKESSSSDGIVYIHKDTKWKFPKSTS